MATYDKKADIFRTASKLGSGFDDVTLFALPERLKAFRVPKKPARVVSRMQPDFWFNPAIVLEVLGAEITLSPTHTCAIGAVRADSGLAVRFPRFTGKWRDDKKPEDATTDEELLGMYRAQLRTIKEEPAPPEPS
jgi:DNA ligase-1